MARHLFILPMLAPLTFTGCELLSRNIALMTGHPESVIEESPGHERDNLQTARLHRDKFASEGDPRSFRWLLGHRVKNGMTVAEVNRVLGVEGERDYADAQYKRDGGSSHESDVGYRWGPDSSGKTVCFLFRDGKLVNHDSKPFNERPFEEAPQSQRAERP